MGRNQAAPYVAVGPRYVMVRVLAVGRPPLANTPPAASPTLQSGQRAMGDVDMAAS